MQHRNAALAIIPAGSIAVVGWLGAAAILIALALLDKRLDRRDVPRTHGDQAAKSVGPANFA